MTLLRKVGRAFAWALLAVIMGQLLVFAQGVPGLTWPAQIVRMGLLIVLLPAVLLRSWLELHLNLYLPLLVFAAPLFLAYHETGKAVARLRQSMQIPARPARRAFLAGAGVVAVSGCGVARSYPAPSLTWRTLPLKDLPPELAGVRVVLLADLHRGPIIGREYLEDVIRRVNELEPDLVLMPGDFVSKSSAYFADVTRILSQLRPGIASLATLGNHDHWEGEEEATRALTAAGVLLLQNRSLHLGPDRRLTSFGERGLCLAGVDDLGSGKPDLNLALAGVAAGVPRLLLSHNPDFAEEKDALRLGHRVDLQLSGHTHGGQVILPGAGPVVSGSRYGMKYLSGWAEGPSWPVFITRGVGAGMVPLRVGAPPEIVLFELAATRAVSRPVA